MVRLFSPRGGEGNKVLPEESIKPVTFDQTGNFRVAGLDEQAATALRGVVSSLRTGGAEAMRAAGERGLVTDWPSGNRFYYTSCKEEEALAWVARAFSRRATFGGELVDWSSAVGVGAPVGGLTTPMAKLLEQLLRETIERGTGENMAALAEWVIQTFRQHHAELPKLRAYTWAAHILGQRILRGEFAPPPSPPPAAPEPPPPGAQPLDISDDLGGGAYTDVSPPSLVDGRNPSAAAASKEQQHVACAPSVARPPASSPRSSALARSLTDSTTSSRPSSSSSSSRPPTGSAKQRSGSRPSFFSLQSPQVLAPAAAPAPVPPKQPEPKEQLVRPDSARRYLMGMAQRD